MSSRHVLKCIAISVLTSVVILWSGSALAEEKAPLTGAELQQAMYNALVVIEKAGGMESTASDAFYWNTPEVTQALEAIPDKELFLKAVTEIIKSSQAARTAGKGEPESPALLSVPEVNGTSAFIPNYPDTSTDLDYLLLKPLGLVTSKSSRCGGSAWPYYQAGLVGAGISLTAAQLACDASGCDPTGIVCISVCGATKIVQAGYLVFKAPVDACDSWEAKLDAAENQAAYKNSESILGDLSAHDTKVGGLLASQKSATTAIAASITTHDAAMKALLSQLDAALRGHNSKLVTHDGDLKLLLGQLLTTMVTNQMEIIKLLKTPEGRRPGWGKDGY